MKKLISKMAFLFCFCVIVGASFVIGATPADAATYGDLTYTVSNGEVTITDCNTSATSVSIPAEIEGYPVTSIGEEAFLNCTSLMSIIIPDSVTSIGEDAFYNCTSLTRVDITDIAAWCNISFADSYSNPLRYASNLYLNGTLVTELTIPEGVTSIGIYAFYGCTRLTSVTIPNSVTSIGNYAFCDCTSLTSVTIGSSVTSIGNYAFEDCTNLTSVTIGNGVTSIGEYAFYGCTSLTSITIPDSITSIDSYTFYNCTNLTSVTIGNGVTSIGYAAFRDCTRLTSVTIPNSVTSIGHYAFEDCTSLTSVTIGSSVTSIGDGAFEDCTSLTSIYYNAANLSDLSSKNYVFYKGGTSADGIKVTIGKDVQRIPAYLFCPYSNYSSYSPKITEVTFEKGSVCTSIGKYAFLDCTSLTEVHIYDIAAWCNISFASSSSNPLYYAENLYLNGTLVTELTIPEGVTSIGNYAFRYCTSLTSINIPNSVTSIGEFAFSGCTSLEFNIYSDGKYLGSDSNPYLVLMATTSTSVTSFTIHPDTKFIYTSAFRDCTSLTSINIPDSVTSIGYEAFRNCTSLARITIPNSVTSIGNYAFSSCTSLTRINIPDSVTSIGNWAFEDCTSLTRVTIGNGVTSIGNGAFRDCTSLTSITIPDSVESIGSYTFDNCTSLTSVTIGNGVTSIGNDAFYNCTDLVSIYYNAANVSDLSADNYVFYEAGLFGDGIKVTIGKDVQRIPAYLFHPYSNDSSYSPKITEVTFEKGSICTSIGDYAFRNCTSLKRVDITDIASWCNISFADSVSNPLCYASNLYLNGTLVTELTIPEGVTSIGDYAFYYCTSLTSVTIPNSVTSIGNYAFCDCTSLTRVDITDIAAWCNISFADSYSNPLRYAKNLYVNDTLVTELTIPEGVTSIGNGAFYNCTSLTSITIPNSVTSIGSSAFSNCTSLTSITITNSVTSIGSSAFSNCTSLTSVTIGNGVTSIGNRAFYNCTSLVSIKIPNSVTSIGNRAFYNCTSLTSVTIGSSVTSIGEYAFYNCTSLTSIYYNAANLSDLSSKNYVFYNAGRSGDGIKVTIGKDVQRIPAYLFCPYYSSYSPKITEVTFEKGSVCTSIGEDAFYYCTSLTRVDITDIAAWCNISFAGSSSNPLRYASNLYLNGTLVTELTIPEGVTSIGIYAFYGCTSLTSVTIGNSVTRIGSYAFSGCSSLESITLPFVGDKVHASTDTYQYPFGYIFGTSSYTGGTATKQYYYGSSTTSTTYTTYYIPTSLKRVTITGGNIPYGAFDNCKNITSVNMHGIQGEIPQFAFRNCLSLNEVSIGYGISGIHDDAFIGSVAIQKVTVSDTVTSIGDWAFYDCADVVCLYVCENSAAHKYAESNSIAYKFITADIDGDGELTNSDITLLVRYLSGWDISDSVSVVFEADTLDFNYDGKINNRDAIWCIRKVAGWEE